MIVVYNNNKKKKNGEITNNNKEDQAFKIVAFEIGMGNISEKIEIRSVANELIFRCSGQFADAEITRAESEGTMEFVKTTGPSTIIQGEFSLKNLGYFIKCTNLCSQIEMYLENNLPLIVEYKVASLGAIKLCLAPLPPS